MTMLMDARFSKLPGVLAVVATVLTHPALAQTPMKEVIDVRVANVEFIATDSKGNHVPGLTRDDFELYENGKLQPITNLFEAGSGAAQDAARKGLPRRLVIYLDDTTLLPNNRKPIIPAVKKLIADTMTPADQVMIVTFNQSSKTRLPWTSDQAAVQSALDTIGLEVGAGRIRQAARSRIEDDIRSMTAASAGGRAPTADFRAMVSRVRNYASSVTHELALSAGALETLFGTLAGIDGRKIVVIASESFPTHPGSEVFDYLERTRIDIMSSDASEGLKRSARSTSVSGAAAEFNTGEAVILLGKVANASGVTVYAIDPSTGGRSESGNVESVAPGQVPGGDAGGVSGVDGLQILARATGGIAWIGTKPAVAFERLRGDLENYYSIGYQAKIGGGAERAIEVKPKRAEIRIRAKKSIVFHSAESEMPGRVTSNLQTAQANDLGISLQVGGEVRIEGDKRRVPVHVLIPASNLTVISEGEVYTGGFSVYVVTAGGKTEPSGASRQTHEIKWPPSAIGQLKGRNMTFAMEVILEKGRDQISVGVLDHRSQATGFSKMAM